MSRIDPIDPEDAPAALQDLFSGSAAKAGFIPNSLRIMAHQPSLALAVGNLFATVNQNDNLPPGLGGMIAHICSYAAGCRYCQAHTHHTASKTMGEAGDKLDHIWEYESHPAFSEAERAALRVAQAAGQVPNAVTDADFEALKAHFTTEQIVQIVAIIAMFGFLNRWNDTMATPLEEPPLDHAKRALTGKGWQAGKHA